MIKYKIPGREDIVIENLVLDYNGTIAHDGKLIPGVEEGLNSLKDINLYVITADTYGTVREECKNLPCEILTFPQENAGEEKARLVRELGGKTTICVGNGYNDIAMFQEAALSIGVMEGEGICGKLLGQADILVRSIHEALNIIADENKVKATLRN